MKDLEILKQEFLKRFGCDGMVYAAPGRVNLIGEHTDYNGGFVFPAAVEQSMTVVIHANGSDRVNLYALDLDATFTFSVADVQMPDSVHARYIYGVVRELAAAGVAVGGFDAVYGGDVPLGAGMSSSAALECCFATALNDIFGGSLSKMELAKIGQATEHKYVGVKCGIMDQFASMHGRKGALMRLDCRSGEFEYFPWQPKGYSLLLINSCVKHELVGSPYNERRRSCEHVAELAGVETLRDCTWEMLDAVRKQLSDEDYRRAKYVVGEKERVLKVCDALLHDDYKTVGEMMYKTHEGLRDDYEVSCEEIDFLVDTARHCGVVGSRIMGGGFGGCTINLLENSVKESFLVEVVTAYRNRFGVDCKVIPVVIGEGARRLS